MPLGRRVENFSFYNNCQQVPTGSVGVRIEEEGEGQGVLREGGLSRASVKEINGLKIGKVNMSCALPSSWDRTLPLPGTTNLFYFRARLDRTWPAQGMARG